MAEPICKKARESGGDVPLECLFHCPHNCMAEYRKNNPPSPPPPADASEFEDLTR